MVKQLWHNLITEKSFKILQELKKSFDFILIGGWAIFLYTHSLKSKDIDIVCEYDELEKIKIKFGVSKNERLKKYETRIEDIDIDIYLPFYSNPGLPAEEIKKYIVSLEGFIVPKPEILLILKQKTFQTRIGTIKGEKDKIDIFSLLFKTDLDFRFYKKLLSKYQQKDLLKNLIDLLNSSNEIPELNINQHKYNRLKKEILKKLK